MSLQHQIKMQKFAAAKVSTCLNDTFSYQIKGILRTNLDLSQKFHPFSNISFTSAIGQWLRVSGEKLYVSQLACRLDDSKQKRAINGRCPKFETVAHH